MASNVVSRFFGASSSDEEEVVPIDEVPKKPIQTFSSSSDEGVTIKRVVKSTNQKRDEEFDNIIKKLKNSIKIKDVEAICSEFDSLQRSIVKYQNTQIPKSVIRTLMEIEDLSKKIWEDKEQKSKLNKFKTKLLGTLRQKIKKQNKDFDKEIEDCRANPEKYDSVSEEEDGGTTSDSDASIVKTKDKTSGVNPFLKVKAVEEIKEKRIRKVNTQKNKSDEDITVSKQKNQKELFKEDEVITFETCLHKLKDIFKLRGKKLSDRALLAMYYDLRNIVEKNNIGIILQIKIIYLIISTQLDSYNADNILKPEQIKNLLNVYREFLNLLNEIVVRFDENISEEQEVYKGSSCVLMGNSILIALKINDEITKIMQTTDQYTLDYVEKMKDIAFFIELILLFQKYLEKYGTNDQICAMYLLRIELIYYRLDNNWLLSLKEQLSESLTMDIKIEKKVTVDENLINGLCKFIYEHGKDRTPVRAALCQAYHHSIHDRYFQAKNIFFSSIIQDSFLQFDIPTQILYNRALVQLGMSAFRQGNFSDAISLLKEIQTSGRIKELLAQGVVNRSIERTPKQDMLDRRNILPFHLHINLELVECIYLVSILVVEGAYSVAPIQQARNNFSSRSLIFLVRNFDKMPIQGPPESMKESVNAAFKSLRVGDWASCVNFIKSIRSWKLLAHSSSVLNILTFKIKKECLVAYIYSNARSLSRISVDYLGETFELSLSDVVSTVNRMILRDKFPAQWNENSTVLSIKTHLLPNNTKMMIATLADKLSNLSENQDRVRESLNLAICAKEKYYTKTKIK